MQKNLLSQIEDVQKSLNFPANQPKKQNDYMTVIKEMEDKVCKVVEYGPKRDTKGMVEDLIMSGILKPGDCNYLSDDEIKMLHEEMHDGIMEATQMGHFEEAESQADMMIESPEQDEMITMADGVDYIDDGLGMEEYTEEFMPAEDVEKAEEGDRKSIFGRMMEFKGGEWTPVEGRAEEEPAPEEPGMEAEDELSAMVEEKGEMIDEMLASGMDPEEIADTLENGKPDELGNGDLEIDYGFDEAIADLQSAGYSDEEIDEMLNTMSLEELQSVGEEEGDDSIKSVMSPDEYQNWVETGEMTTDTAKNLFNKGLIDSNQYESYTGESFPTEGVKPRTIKEALSPEEYKVWVETGELSPEKEKELRDAGLGELI